MLEVDEDAGCAVVGTGSLELLALPAPSCVAAVGRATLAGDTMGKLYWIIGMKLRFPSVGKMSL